MAGVDVLILSKLVLGRLRRRACLEVQTFLCPTRELFLPTDALNWGSGISSINYIFLKFPKARKNRHPKSHVSRVFRYCTTATETLVSSTRVHHIGAIVLSLILVLEVYLHFVASNYYHSRSQNQRYPDTPGAKDLSLGLP